MPRIPSRRLLLVPRMDATRVGSRAGTDSLDTRTTTGRRPRRTRMLGTATAQTQAAKEAAKYGRANGLSAARVSTTLANGHRPGHKPSIAGALAATSRDANRRGVRTNDRYVHRILRATETPRAPHGFPHSPRPTCTKNGRGVSEHTIEGINGCADRQNRRQTRVLHPSHRRRYCSQQPSRHTCTLSIGDTTRGATPISRALCDTSEGSKRRRFLLLSCNPHRAERRTRSRLCSVGVPSW